MIGKNYLVKTEDDPVWEFDLRWADEASKALARQIDERVWTTYLTNTTCTSPPPIL